MRGEARCSACDNSPSFGKLTFDSLNILKRIVMELQAYRFHFEG